MSFIHCVSQILRKLSDKYQHFHEYLMYAYEIIMVSVIGVEGQSVSFNLVLA